jgi:hypothetical protein
VEDIDGEDKLGPGLPEDSKIVFRIGINLGDVIQEKPSPFSVLKLTS